VISAATVYLGFGLVTQKREEMKVTYPSRGSESKNVRVLFCSNRDITMRPENI
jgi:hypothetical protein